MMVAFAVQLCALKLRECGEVGGGGERRIERERKEGGVVTSMPFMLLTTFLECTHPHFQDVANCLVHDAPYLYGALQNDP